MIGFIILFASFISWLATYFILSNNMSLLDRISDSQVFARRYINTVLKYVFVPCALIGVFTSISEHWVWLTTKSPIPFLIPSFTFEAWMGCMLVAFIVSLGYVKLVDCFNPIHVSKICWPCTLTLFIFIHFTSLYLVHSMHELKVYKTHCEDVGGVYRQIQSKGLLVNTCVDNDKYEKAMKMVAESKIKVP